MALSGRCASEDQGRGAVRAERVSRPGTMISLGSRHVPAMQNLWGAGARCKRILGDFSALAESGLMGRWCGGYPVRIRNPATGPGPEGECLTSSSPVSPRASRRAFSRPVSRRVSWWRPSWLSCSVRRNFLPVGTMVRGGCHRCLYVQVVILVQQADACERIFLPSRESRKRIFRGACGGSQEFAGQCIFVSVGRGEARLGERPVDVVRAERAERAGPGAPGPGRALVGRSSGCGLWGHEPPAAVGVAVGAMRPPSRRRRAAICIGAPSVRREGRARPGWSPGRGAGDVVGGDGLPRAHPTVVFWDGRLEISEILH